MAVKTKSGNESQLLWSSVMSGRSHLADVLAEGRVGNHLTQEVEVRGHQRHDAAADKHGQVLFVGKSHFLHKPVAKTVLARTNQQLGFCFWSWKHQNSPHTLGTPSQELRFTSPLICVQGYSMQQHFSKVTRTRIFYFHTVSKKVVVKVTTLRWHSQQGRLNTLCHMSVVRLRGSLLLCGINNHVKTVTHWVRLCFSFNQIYQRILQ